MAVIQIDSFKYRIRHNVWVSDGPLLSLLQSMYRSTPGKETPYPDAERAADAAEAFGGTVLDYEYDKRPGEPASI